ncbi:MAG: polysaccharide deacetylase family protein [Candidatus Krumholzibacteriota bacterium]|nr:polysaccharide deacetylase family protein [Candidatus Krumholzibacteriota bacterium]
MKNETPVPVLMYHTVGIPNKDWMWKHLTCPYDKFENQMKWLRKTGFVTINLEDLYNSVFNNKKLPKKSVILTFDDGFADNWIFAYPIMKKYGMKGTIFVNPEFVDKRNIIRKRADEVSSIDKLNLSDTSGFLSWQELQIGEKEGVFDPQSHAMTHTWYPVSDKIIDFRHPSDIYIWNTWNNNIDKKPHLQFDDENLINYGEPVYENDKSLSSPRYFPDKEIALDLKRYVETHGNIEFFKGPRWKEILFEQAEKAKKIHKNDRYESEKEYKERIWRELYDSKKILEENLNKKVEFLCWPGGSGTQTGVYLARKIGYKMTTAAKDLPRSFRDSLLNLPSEKSDRFSRTSAILFWDGRTEKDSKVVYHSGFTLILSLLEYKRIFFAHFWARLIRKILKEILRLFKTS